VRVPWRCPLTSILSSKGENDLLCGGFNQTNMNIPINPKIASAPRASQRRKGECLSPRESWATDHFRISPKSPNAASFDFSPVSVTGPTQEGHPLSHGHCEMSFKVFSKSFSVSSKS